MLIPYGTDSPIYHWPLATCGLIVANILTFVLQTLSADMGIDQYALTHGDGLHPVQWISSFFIHGDILHLIGNMIFLWAFGLIVEGKTGPLLFTVLYFGIGFLQNALEQVLFLSYATGPSLGASSAIYGIMMVALLWAPQDNIKCIFMIWYYVYLIEVPIAMFGLVYFLWDFSLALFSGFSMGTALLHVMGALVGLVPGIAFLVTHWVDAEQRDLISMLRELIGGQPLTKPTSKKEIESQQHAREQAIADRVKTIERCWQSMDTHLQVGNVKAATELFRQMRNLDARLQWQETTLLKVIEVLQQKEDWDNVVIYSNEYLENFRSKSKQVQLNLARLFLLHKVSPRKAIKTVQQIDMSKLNEKQAQVAQQIIRQSEDMIADGVLEIGDE